MRMSLPWLADIAADYTKTKVKELSEEVHARKGDIHDLGFSFYDKKTFFHRGHVSSIETVAAADRIGSEQVLAIRHVLSEWCDDHGSLVGMS
jgi:hypothetical protein